MTYEQMQDCKPEHCKRACGVHPQTCEKRLQVLRAHVQRKLNDHQLKAGGFKSFRRT